MKRKFNIQRHIRTVVRMERKFEPAIALALQWQITLFISDYKRLGRTIAVNNLLSLKGNERLNKPLMEIYKTFGLWQYNTTEAQIEVSAVEKKAIGFSFNPKILADIIAHFQRYLLAKVVIPITETTTKIILAALIRGEEQGLGVKDIVALIDNTEITKARARLIVRTEAIIAMNYGRQSATKSSRWETESTWIASDDSRTRHSHRDIDNGSIDEGQRFSVPIYKKDQIVGYDHMTGPGDPDASAGNVCNCRCSMTTTAKRTLQGKLIPKRNISVILPGQFVRNNQFIPV